MSSHDYLSNLLNDLQNDDGSLPDNVLPFIGFLISKAAQTIVQNVDTSLEPFGITSRHYGIMVLLSHNDGLPQIAVGQKLKIDRTTMVKLVDGLEQAGLVERHRDPNDRRAYALSLSAKGVNMLPEMTRTVVDEEQTSLANLSEEEVRLLLRVLLKLQ